MGGPIVINYSANVKDAVSGTDQLSKAVEKTADSADTAQKGIGKSADKTLQAQKDAAKGIVRASADAAKEQVTAWSSAAIKQGKSVHDVQEVVETVYNKIDADVQRTNSTIESSSAQSWDKAEQAVRDFGGNTEGVLQTAASALGSFDGSIGSLGTTISGLAALIPGVGGLIGGALGGIASKLFQDWDENSKKSAKAVADMYDDMTASGDKYLSEDFLKTKIHDIIKDAEQLKVVKNNADIAGVSLQTALRAEANDPNAIAAVLKAANKELDALKASTQDPSALSVRSTQNLIDHYKELQKQFGSSLSGIDLFNQATSKTAEAAAKAGGSASTAAGQVDGLNKKLKETPDSKTINVKLTGLTDAERQVGNLIRERSLTVNVKARVGNQVF